MSLLRKLILSAAITAVATAAPAYAVDYTWNGGGSASWNTNANWLPNTGFPNSSSDTATFNSTATITTGIPSAVSSITIAASTSLTFGSTTVASFSVTTGTFTVAGGTLTVTTSASVDSALVINGTVVMDGVLSLTSGADVTGSGTLNNSGTVEAIDGDCGLGANLVIDDDITAIWQAYGSSNEYLTFGRSNTTLAGAFLVDSGAHMKVLSGVDIETSGDFTDPDDNADCGDVDTSAGGGCSFKWSTTTCP